ncbi:carbohydrate kinase [Enterococcus moraviensis ATCC BAA-383]|uniref:Carbohydrate kinase n=1 Tax=Enterococcus moraviensis ATCC BAA-383 TaxID=1158609 RepID=R2TXF3_9ENTE|nr:sugar kinase [Enterococcus moraviensis]EOI05002.1 carbohydrate kinase [Enterococcus moraviensis ATCC BAA-383]EOT63785.1 carbohydrate kinase [Enterococcus moraviensis ATCC BAA-383]OJG67083.1 carbohydrate kinase [Enterococcus moraviensis]
MRIVAFGEIMMRLTPPEYLMLEQTKELRLDFTGTGVNILSNLAHFGCQTSLLTNLPDNRLGEAAKASVRQLGIQDHWIGTAGDHIGSYFAEMGFGPRPTQVTYQNRRNSSFGISNAASYDFDAILAETDLIHICGISLSLTEETRSAAFALAEKAHDFGKKVCFDFNFRPSLNEEHGVSFMKEQYEKILPYCDLVFGSQRDLTDLLGMKLDETLESSKQFEELVHRFMTNYQLEYFAGTLRQGDGDKQYLTGFLVDSDHYVQAAPREIINLDRIGAGDGYAAGVLLGYSEAWPLIETVEFATANGVLAHTIQGDVPLTTRKQVRHIMEQPTVDLIR